MSGIVNYAFDKLKTKLDASCHEGNVGTSERILSVIAGGFILGMGLKSIVKRPMRAFSGVTLGGALIYRGVTGYCPVKESIEPNEPEATVIEHRYFVK